MASKLQIVNMALAHIGLKPLADLDGTDPITTAVNTYYDYSLEDVFSEHRWPFANVKTALSEITVEDDDIEWDFMYTYPSSAARVFLVYSEGSVTTKEYEEFEVIYLTGSTRKVILTNTEDAYAEYTYIMTDTTKWEPKFTLAFSYRLAALIAFSVTGDVDNSVKMNDIYASFIGEAKRLSFQEKIKAPYPKTDTIDARG